MIVTVIHRDSETDLTINHLTTSPVTNHVCEVHLLILIILLPPPFFITIITSSILHTHFQFFPESKGQINERYSYEHQVCNKYRSKEKCFLDFINLPFHGFVKKFMTISQS